MIDRILKGFLLQKILIHRTSLRPSHDDDDVIETDEQASKQTYK